VHTFIENWHFSTLQRMDKEQERDVILAHLKEVKGTTLGMTFTNPEDVMLAEEYMR
jgi:hypothetical protein